MQTNKPDRFTYQDHLGIERPACNINQVFSTLNSRVNILPEISWRHPKIKWRLETRAMVSILIKLDMAIRSLRKRSISQALESTIIIAQNFPPGWFKCCWFEPQQEPETYFWPVWLPVFGHERKEAIDQTCLVDKFWGKKRKSHLLCVSAGVAVSGAGDRSSITEDCVNWSGEGMIFLAGSNSLDMAGDPMELFSDSCVESTA
ncbi:hypothetical protein LWI29_003736 [Acer saccharum]|uniref:Uncharacterized protein n=1 Tax=Acer saccharum TaxID=4024 RepID=A0AA39SL76_ACESA|nr:hypothetical protein LWI29_003736 [Acer saccharum]